jgi:hypothetical protein
MTRPFDLSCRFSIFQWLICRSVGFRQPLPNCPCRSVPGAKGGDISGIRLRSGLEDFAALVADHPFELVTCCNHPHMKNAKAF